jgi:hypothetical protein
LDDKRTYYLEILQKLCSEKFVGSQPPCFKKNLPLIRVQLGYFFHLLNYNKLRPETLAKESVYPRHSLKISTLKGSVKWRIKLPGVKKRYGNMLNDKILLFGFSEHYYGSNANLYLSPFKSELIKKNVLHEELLISNNSTVKQQSKLNDLYRLLYDYNQQAFSLRNVWSGAEKEAITNAGIVKDFLKKENVPYTEHVGNIIYKTQIEQEIKYHTFTDLLELTKPKLIWTYVFYDNAVTALIRAANKLAIPTVEYQHSAQSDKHFAYAKWQNAEYYKDFFPDTFWVWSKYDAERVLRNFSGNAFTPKVIAGGNLSVLQQKETEATPRKQNTKGVLVSLQGTWIPAFLEKVIEQDTEHQWYFRLHPRYPEDKEKLNAFQERFPNKIETEEANRLTLYELFRKVNVSVTDFSGVALEAAQFGIKNIIVGQAGSEVYAHEIADGTFNLALNENDFTKGISNAQNVGIGSWQQNRETLEKCLAELLTRTNQV